MRSLRHRQAKALHVGNVSTHVLLLPLAPEWISRLSFSCQQVTLPTQTLPLCPVLSPQTWSSAEGKVAAGDEGFNSLPLSPSTKHTQHRADEHSWTLPAQLDAPSSHPSAQHGKRLLEYLSSQHSEATERCREGSELCKIGLLLIK